LSPFGVAILGWWMTTKDGIAATFHSSVIVINKKPCSEEQGFLFESLGWLMGLEPTTTGITILDSTN
jgi:hypothetical protein